MIPESDVPSGAVPAATAPRVQRAKVIRIAIAYILIFCVALPAFLIATGLRLDRLVPSGWNASLPLLIIGAGTLCTGLYAMVAAMLQLSRRGKGLPISRLPPVALVANGWYRRVRHPIYVAFTIAFTGAALLLASFWSIVFCLPLLLIGWVCYAVFYEEPTLIRRFGDRYLALREQTPLLLPRRLSRAAGSLVRSASASTAQFLARRTLVIRPSARGRYRFAYAGTFYAAGAMLSLLLLASLLLSAGFDAQVIAGISVALTVAGLLTARLFAWLKLPFVSPETGGAGYASWGGLTGTAAAATACAWAYGIPAGLLGDVLMRSFFCGYAVGCLGWMLDEVSRRSHAHEEARRSEPQSNRAATDPIPPRLSASTAPLFAVLTGAASFAVLQIISLSEVPEGFVLAMGLMLFGLVQGFIAFIGPEKRIRGGVFTRAHAGCLVVFVCGWSMLFFIDPGHLAAHLRIGWQAFADMPSVLAVDSVLAMLVLFSTGIRRKSDESAR